MRLLFVAASPRRDSRSRRLVRLMLDHAARRHGEHEIDLLDLREAAPEPFRGFDEDYAPATRAAIRRVEAADAWLVGSPVFNGSFSSALKNLFEHVPADAVEDRVAGLALVGGGGKSFLQVRSHFETLMTYFKVRLVPRAAYATRDEVDEGLPDALLGRLAGVVDDVVRTRQALLEAGAGRPAAEVPSR